jgi:hypothetical protein
MPAPSSVTNPALRVLLAPAFVPMRGTVGYNKTPKGVAAVTSAEVIGPPLGPTPPSAPVPPPPSASASDPESAEAKSKEAKKKGFLAILVAAGGVYYLTRG